MKICIFGQMHNGKTTYANMLQQELHKVADEYFYLAAWAARIKTLVTIKYGVTLDFIAEWKSKNQIPPGFNVTMREVLQKEGEHSRECKTNVWIDNLIREYANINIIIDDGRHLNEAKAVFDDGGYNILIVRQGHYNKSEHPSEKAIGNLIQCYKNNDPIPHEWTGLIHEIVGNNFGLDELADSARFTSKTILDKIKGKK